MMGMEFHEKLVTLCEQKGWDQSELARRACVSKPTVNAWWNGKGKPKWEAALKLARALKVSLDFLADDRQDKPPKVPKLSDGERAILRQARLMGVENALETLVEARIERATKVAPAPPNLYGTEIIPRQDEQPPKGKRSG